MCVSVTDEIKSHNDLQFFFFEQKINQYINNSSKLLILKIICLKDWVMYFKKYVIISYCSFVFCFFIVCSKITDIQCEILMREAYMQKIAFCLSSLTQSCFIGRQDSKVERLLYHLSISGLFICCLHQQSSAELSFIFITVLWFDSYHEFLFF